MDLNNLMNLAKSMQGSFSGIGTELKDKLKNIYVHTSVGGGAVCVQMNGLYEMIQLDVREELIRAEEKPMLQDLLKLAFNQSVQDIRVKQKELFKAMGLPLDMLGGIL